METQETEYRFHCNMTVLHKQMLEEIAKVKYRGVSLTHAIRLLIEDAARGMKENESKGIVE